MITKWLSALVIVLGLLIMIVSVILGAVNVDLKVVPVSVFTLIGLILMAGGGLYGLTSRID